MLGKLLKYDLKADVLFYYIMTAVIAGVTLLASGIIMIIAETEFQNPFIYMSCISMIGIYIVALVAAAIFTTVIIFKRFYSHNFAQEGYLTFTLPVTANQIFWSKFISALIWTVWTGVLVIASLVIVLLSIQIDWDIIDFTELYDILKSFYNSLNLFMVLNVLNYIISILLSIFVIYLAICIGQNFTVHRVIAAVAAYFIINWTKNIVVSLFSAMVLIVCEIGSGTFESFEIYSNASIVIEIVINIAVIIGSYFYCIRKMSKGLNLR